MTSPAPSPRWRKRDFHTHTRWCDGTATADEMARAALALGMEALGFSGHSYTAYDTSCAMLPAEIARYAAEVGEARRRYAGQLEIYLGIEDDLHGDRPAFPRDYTIGSAHEVFADGTFFSVDHTPEILADGVRAHFGGDWYAMTRAYFQSVATVRDVTGCDVVGHFDLVTKFNEGGCRFDEADPRYLGPALEAAEHLCRQGCLFEINTGAITRGYRTAPYPSRRLLEAIRGFGGRVLLASDAHHPSNLCGRFAEAAALAASCGYRELWTLTPSGGAPYGT